jgi:WD40 repeat protein
MAISPDERLLGVGEQNGKIMIYELSGEYPVIISKWCWHTARIMSLDWSACSAFLASSSLDTNIYVWSVAKPTKNIPIKVCVFICSFVCQSYLINLTTHMFKHQNAHVGGTTEVIWEAEGKLLSCGSDGAIRKFSIKLESLT